MGVIPPIMYFEVNINQLFLFSSNKNISFLNYVMFYFYEKIHMR